MIGAIVGIYFVQSQQFSPVTAETPMVDAFRNPNPTLDLLVPSMPRGLNWAAIVLFAIGWIIWEVAISRYGNKKIGIAALVLVFASLFFTMNLISYVFGLTANAMMIYFLIDIPWSIKNKDKVKAFEKNQLETKQNSEKWKFSNLFKKNDKKIKNHSVLR